jgi:hypothetical protein
MMTRTVKTKIMIKASTKLIIRYVVCPTRYLSGVGIALVTAFWSNSLSMIECADVADSVDEAGAGCSVVVTGAGCSVIVTGDDGSVVVTGAGDSGLVTGAGCMVDWGFPALMIIEVLSYVLFHIKPTSFWTV